MAKKRKEPRKLSPPPSAFDQARDELFSHILRCGVLEATPEHQKEWFDLAQLRTLGERYCRPVVGRRTPVGADA